MRKLASPEEYEEENEIEIAIICQLLSLQTRNKLPNSPCVKSKD